MVEKVDRRVQKTRKALQQALIDLALEKGFEDLNVQDILDRANVGRSTFYSHFYDKDDLLHSEFENLQTDFEKAFLENENHTSDILAFSLVLFTHAKHYHAVYKVVVGKQSGQVMQAKIEDYLKTIIHEALVREWKPEKQEVIPLEILENHLTNSLIRLLIWWLDNDLPHSPQRMDEIYRHLVAPILAKA